MYDEIMRIPADLMNNPKNLFLIPAIFLNKYRHIKSCHSLKECVLK